MNLDIRSLIDLLKRVERVEKFIDRQVSSETGPKLATAAPGVGDDSADGFAIGSIWIDTALDNVYICCDATAGSAVWKKITP